MKHKICTTVLFCALCFFTSRSFAQKGFQIGIRYMVQKTTLFNKSDKNAGAELDKESTWSYLNGGLALDYAFNHCMGIEVEILHSRQGQSYSGTNMQANAGPAYNREVTIQAAVNNESTTGSYQAKAELNCTKIPVLFKLSTGSAKPVYYTLAFGPQINFLSNAVYEFNKEDVDLPGLNIEPNDTYKKTTFDGVMAFGVGFNLSRHWVLSAQARFDYGFQDVEEKNVTYTMNTITQNYYGAGRSSTHNGTAALEAGLSYRL